MKTIENENVDDAVHDAVLVLFDECMKNNSTKLVVIATSAHLSDEPDEDHGDWRLEFIQTRKGRKPGSPLPGQLELPLEAET